MEAQKIKAESLAEKMNKLTEKFNIAEEILIEGDDIIEYVSEHTTNVELFKEDIETINLQLMVDDFAFVRETLKESIDNGRKVLTVITLDLLDTEDDKRASLILSFAELNKAVADNTKLYMQSYREISTVLLNLDKIKKEKEKNKPDVVNNTVNINNLSAESIEQISTMDIIKRLKGN